MSSFKKIIIIFLLFLNTCGKNVEVPTSVIEEKSIEGQIVEIYNKGLEALEKNDFFYAAKNFNEVELIFPQSEWAPRSALMSAYAHWLNNDYNKSVKELKRFLKIYPNSDNLDYANYLIAMCYFNSIVDEKKDINPLIKSQLYFQVLLDKYPNTDYALDAKYKMALIEESLAAKEMYIARHYMKKRKWGAAINRLKYIVEDFEETIFVQEALHRLVEVYYVIGLEEEAQKYAVLLGYNYQSSEWYNKSYKVFNKGFNTQKKIIQKKNKIKLIDRVKSFF